MLDWSSILSIQMFKVYQDPEGTQCLTQNNTIQVTNKSIADENDEIYKRKIEDLNEKIKVINDELEMVSVQC